MEFKKYNSIENSYQIDFLNAIKENGFQNQEYIVQEKVHGANVCFITDGKQIVSAKRTELILDDEIFFNSNSIQKRYEPNILQLFRLVSDRIPNIEQVTVFGELFGGVYPHAEVAKVSSAILVQKGIYYSSDNDFYAFDILVNRDQYLDTETINELFEATGFLYAKSLFRGSLDDCLKYPNNFQSTIPKEFGLPELKQNICEGVVIRPVKPCFFNNGSRVLIKNKNERWKENNNFLDKEFLKAALSQQETLSDDAQLLCEEITKYISENRLYNVISKIGSVTQKDFGKVLGLFCKDALDDFLKDHKNEYEQLEKHECKAINKFLNTHSVSLVSDYWKNL